MIPARCTFTKFLVSHSNHPGNFRDVQHERPRYVRDAAAGDDEETRRRYRADLG